MKLMTYNMYEGGVGDMTAFSNTVNQISPEILVLNEANSFAKYKHRSLKKFASECGFEHFDIALSGQWDYHVAILSKIPWVHIEKIEGLKRAGIMIVLKTYIGEVSIIGTHLAPDNEDIRLTEVRNLLDKQKKFKYRVLMGDLNSLSGNDPYPSHFVKKFNETQIKKFTRKGKLRFNVIREIEKAGYFDSAVITKLNSIITAPTSVTIDKAHSDMRLDYIMISNTLKRYFKTYSVIKNELTEKASDHYPVVVQFEAH